MGSGAFSILYHPSHLISKTPWINSVLFLFLIVANVFSDADMEDYGFEYSDEEPEEQDVDIENQYYNSKGSFFSFFYIFSIAWIFNLLLFVIVIWCIIECIIW